MVRFHLSKSFISKLAELEYQAWEHRDRDTIVNVRNICDCLGNGFTIDTDLEIEELQRIVSHNNTGIHTNEIDRVLNSAIKLDLLTPANLSAIMTRPQDVCLLDYDVNIPYKQGTISSVDPIDFANKLKTWKSFNKEVKKDDNYENINNIRSIPSNALVFIDPDLIQPKKFDKFIGFLQTFLSDRLSLRFHLTIYSNIDKTGNEKHVLDLITRLDSIIGLDYEIILVSKIFTDNRVYVSNYSSGSFQHPFDRDDIISVSFLPNEIGGLQIAKSYIYKFVKQTNYYNMKQSLFQKIYRNNTDFVNRLVNELCPT